MLNADKKFIAGVRSWAESKNLLEDYLWMKNAGVDQDVLCHYGTANFARLKAIALKYDEDMVFQKLCKCSFKLRV